jgi:hypothetical protein
MSKDSKPTKTAAVSKRKPRKKGAVSKDNKPMKTATVSNDTKPTKTATVSEDSKPMKTASVSNDMKPREKGVAGENPVFDFNKLISQFQLPGVDFTALVDRERKNIEALVKANRIAFEGWQRLVRRQAEMLQETMKKGVPMLARKTP